MVASVWLHLCGFRKAQIIYSLCINVTNMAGGRQRIVRLYRIYAITWHLALLDKKLFLLRGLSQIGT